MRFAEMFLAPFALLALFGVVVYVIPGAILMCAGAVWTLTGSKLLAVVVAGGLIFKYIEVVIM